MKLIEKKLQIKKKKVITRLISLFGYKIADWMMEKKIADWTKYLSRV